METICCICGETVKSPYNVIVHEGEGKLRVYEGHKHCLPNLSKGLENREDIKYTRVDLNKNKPKKE